MLNELISTLKDLVRTKNELFSSQFRYKLRNIVSGNTAAALTSGVSIIWQSCGAFWAMTTKTTLLSPIPSSRRLWPYQPQHRAQILMYKLQEYMFNIYFVFLCQFMFSTNTYNLLPNRLPCSKFKRTLFFFLQKKKTSLETFRWSIKIENRIVTNN